MGSAYPKNDLDVLNTLGCARAIQPDHAIPGHSDCESDRRELRSGAGEMFPVREGRRFEEGTRNRH